jgi:O-antigen/teichoic acid export membrane protein
LTRFIQTNKLSHVTPDIAADPLPLPEKRIPSTAGMTTKVVKGSMWTLGGSVLPLAVSFISTPFIIRFLGSEAYGVLILVGLIPAYFSFADFGMSVASTKFAAEAYGEGDEKKEAEFVWAATAIAALSALVIAVPLFILSYPIVQILNVPEDLLAQASIGLKITSGGFFVGILASVLNSPMLARLRMDMNMLTSAVPKILLAAVTPVILYFGGHIIGAVSWAFAVSLGTFALVVYFSARLLPRLLVPALNRDLIRPLVKFGGATFIAVVAMMFLGNVEKFFLTKMVSVQALAYYSIAFTFANMATFFSQAMLQSLIPAFSQMNSVEKRPVFDDLFNRAMRLTLAWAIPVTAFLVIVAKPFFSLWINEEFGRESSGPLYLLCIGFLFGLLSFVPMASMTAFGRQDVFVKLYWIELPLFALLVAPLVYYYGAIGAALAWSIRIAVDSVLLRKLSKSITHHSFRLADHIPFMILSAAVLGPAILFSIFGELHFLWISLIGSISFMVYAAVTWRFFLRDEEKAWLQAFRRKLLS